MKGKAWRERMKQSFGIKPIGIVHSTLKTRKDATSSNTVENTGEIEIFKEYEKGLTDIEDRPNQLGLTIVELLERKGNRLKVKGIDMIEGTSVLDIKPYTLSHVKIPTKFGWLTRYQPH